MSEKMDLFVEFYSLTGNATKAAIHAGYSEKTAKQQGYKLKNQLQDKIEERVKRLEKILLSCTAALIASMAFLIYTLVSHLTF